jgi:hypothetical protein
MSDGNRSQGGRAIRSAEVVAERSDGTRVPIIPYPTPLRDGTGKTIGAINMLVDVSERKHAETQQRILLNELNHRVKNNMQMSQILLEAGARRAESSEAREVLDEASGRVAAMAAAQRALYRTSDATRFNAGDFLNTVCETAKQTFPQALDIDCQADAAQLSNDAAMPLALIANELTSGHRAVRRWCGSVLLPEPSNDERSRTRDKGPGITRERVMQGPRNKNLSHSFFCHRPPQTVGHRRFSRGAIMSNASYRVERRSDFADEHRRIAAVCTSAEMRSHYSRIRA